MRTTLVFIAIAIAGAMPHAQTRPASTLPPALARVLTDYEKGWQARDAKALAELFVDGRVVVPNACPPANSRAEVEKCYAGSGGDLSLRALAHGTDGSLGYIIGEYGPKAGAPPSGKFVLTLWKGADGRWLILADMDRAYRRPQSSIDIIETTNVRGEKTCFVLPTNDSPGPSTWRSRC